jgi:acylaminoacyl-peptidase
MVEVAVIVTSLINQLMGSGDRRLQGLSCPMMYNELAKIPVPTGAQFLGTCPGQSLSIQILSARSNMLTLQVGLDPTIIQVFYSMTDFTKNVKRQMSNFLTVFPPSENGATPRVSATIPADISETVLQRNSPTRRKRALLRKVSNGNGGSSTSRLVEIWEDGMLQVSLDVTDFHDDFYTDGTFLNSTDKELPLLTFFSQNFSDH